MGRAGGRVTSFLLAASLLVAACHVVGGDLRRQDPATCATCHAEIVRRWRTSQHARAWTDPTFATDTDSRTNGLCLPCHAPAPLLEGAPASDVILREHGRENGVDCVACHYVEGAYAGPYAPTVGPHPMRRDLTRLPCASFCGRCHLAEEAEYDDLYLSSVEAPKTCAGCHMPTHGARLTQGKLLSSLHPRRVVHDHAFPTFDARVSAGAIVATRPQLQGSRVTFSLTNVGAGHRIPTGRFGHREVLIRVEVLDAGGARAGLATTFLLAEDAEGLAPGESTPFALRVEPEDDATPAIVRLVVERVNEDRSFRFTLLDRRWSLTTGPSARPSPPPR